MKKKISKKTARKRVLFIFSMAIIAITLFTLAFLRNTRNYNDTPITNQFDNISFKDIDTALKKGVNFESLGVEQKHILFFLAKRPYSLEIISYLKKSGVDLHVRDKFERNALEDILLNLSPSNKNLEESFYSNILTLLNLELSVSDKIIREASQKCESDSVMTCLKIALYFKARGKSFQAASYAKRSCYSSKDNSICAIATKLILKE